MSDRAPLRGRVALVTGAASGIGRATAIRLAADGAAVGCLDRSADGATRTADDIVRGGGRAAALAADITDPLAVGAAVERLVSEIGPVAILVNNAGVPGGGAFTDISFEEWRRVLDVHVDGTFHVTKAVLPGMTAANWGRIVNICSEAVWLGNQSVQYVTAKAALVGFTRALAYQLAPSGILVNAVAPGPVDTPMLRDNDAAAIDAELASVRIGRFLEPDEIAASIAFLVGPGGDAYVGQVLSPNGGTVFVG
ncbi:MAG TPA: SDR family NAD(P)-dependent oxidoreductase [Candidatus Limnocylindrales bacterium]|nr:SDR family NAD(P)-dependent oxidoreductase [Candidatus Limnocylindrales bacterium]